MHMLNRNAEKDSLDPSRLEEGGLRLPKFDFESRDPDTPTFNPRLSIPLNQLSSEEYFQDAKTEYDEEIVRHTTVPQ